MSAEPPDRDSDPFGPPELSTQVRCLHCGQDYESYLIEWRVFTSADGSGHGFWCCPIPGCDGKGFGFDIFPTDPDYFDEDVRWVDDAEEDEADSEANGFHDGGPEQPPESDRGDEEIPW